jgi:hypothetical protein
MPVAAVVAQPTTGITRQRKRDHANRGEHANG